MGGVFDHTKYYGPALNKDDIIVSIGDRSLATIKAYFTAKDASPDTVTLIVQRYGAALACFRILLRSS